MASMILYSYFTRTGGCRVALSYKAGQIEYTLHLLVRLRIFPDSSRFFQASVVTTTGLGCGYAVQDHTRDIHSVQYIEDHKYYGLDIVNVTTYNPLLGTPRSDSSTHQKGACLLIHQKEILDQWIKLSTGWTSRLRPSWFLSSLCDFSSLCEELARYYPTGYYLQHNTHTETNLYCSDVS
ncbi:uncharacterized protein YALI1_A09919t [Yarrowia lipolytica]|jgi:hypothetical protein|uniref:Uncharacterized protein n=1 Tax=Yarrowia lipolytica TaxID=4952 RepID=A0A1D8N4B4_YARLL|nr:hypothetical protein YALI1_A09919t [Yarrowia lipolytica]